jgi:hypothetical protein
MKFFAVIFTAVFFTFAGCASKPTPGVANPNTNQAAPVTAQPAPLSPKEVLRALNKASTEKDVAGIKKQLSQGTLAMLNETAETEERTAEDILTDEGGAPFLKLPEMLEEKIDGDKATVEVVVEIEDKKGIIKQNEIIPFVKENGEWKVALDLYVEDQLKRAAEDMKRPAGKK